MTGVASPMLKRSKQQGVRFLAGLAIGGIAAALVLSLLVYLIGILALSPIPIRERLLLVSAIAIGLGAADLMHRTPHVSRQVPQRLVRMLPSGTLGVVWGFDLGLLFSTQKTTSLIWVAIVAALIIAPSSAIAILVGIALMLVAVVALGSLSLNGRLLVVLKSKLLAAGGHARLIGAARRTSGVVILCLVAALTWQAIQT
jgi:hypothetical protein